MGARPLALMIMVLPSWAFAQDAEDDSAQSPEQPADQTGAEGEQSVSPEDDARAEQLYLVGDGLYAQGRYEESIAAFEEAYELSRRPLLLFNLANAQERAGRWEDALASLRAYGPNAPSDEQALIQNRIASLEERITRLRRIRETPQAPEPPPRQPENPDQTSVPEPAPAPVEAPPMRGPGLVGAAGVTLVTGVGLAIAAAGARSELDEHCVTQEGRRICLSDATPIADRDRRLSISADVMLGFTLGLAVAGVSLWVRDWVRHDRAEAEPSVEATMGASRHGVAMSLRGHF